MWSRLGILPNVIKSWVLFLRRQQYQFEMTRSECFLHDVKWPILLLCFLYNWRWSTSKNGALAGLFSDSKDLLDDWWFAFDSRPFRSLCNNTDLSCCPPSISTSPRSESQETPLLYLLREGSETTEPRPLQIWHATTKWILWFRLLLRWLIVSHPRCSVFLLRDVRTK